MFLHMKKILFHYTFRQGNQNRIKKLIYYFSQMVKCIIIHGSGVSVV